MDDGCVQDWRSLFVRELATRILENLMGVVESRVEGFLISLSALCQGRNGRVVWSRGMQLRFSPVGHLSL